jgi:G:T/U-mismatch repair DNA glycosylase
MDLSQLSTEDLIAMRSGDLSRVSVEGLKAMQGMAAAQDPMAIKAAQQKKAANAYAGEDVGAMGTVMRGLGGAKASWDRAAMGLKGLFTDLTPQDKQLLEGGKAFVEEGGPAATVGNVAGDVAIYAAPSARAIQGIQAASNAAKAVPMLGKALAATRTGLGSTAAGSALTSAALAPEDRAGAAMGGAAGGALGYGAGQVLTKTLGGLASSKVTPAARELMEQGADVPIWKATDSRIVRNMAERGKVLPVAGDIIRGQERSGIESWNKILLREATPPTPVLDDVGNVLRWKVDPVNDVGTAGLNKLAQKFDDAYGALYGNRGVPVDDVFQAQLSNLSQSTRRYLPSAADDVDGVISKVTDILAGPTAATTTRAGGQPVGKGLVSSRIKTPVTTSLEPGREVISHDALKQAIKSVDDSVDAAWRAGNGEKAEALSALRDNLQSLRARGLPPEVAAEADAINKAYAKFKTVERAATSVAAQKAGGVVTPGQQINSIKARDKTPGKSAFARGNAPGQQQALTAQEVYGNQLPDIGPGTAEKLLPMMGFGLPMMGMDAGATALLGTQTGQNLLMGKYPMQNWIRNRSPYVIDALRTYGQTVGQD